MSDYCGAAHQQRAHRIEKSNSPIHDGAMSPACEQACPTEAIVFGNANDKNSRVAKLKAQQRNYSLLGELKCAAAHHVSRGGAAIRTLEAQEVEAAHFVGAVVEQ